jgi:hypothetical protein
MRCLVSLLAVSLVAACSAPHAGPPSSLAARPAEVIDPRLPIASESPTGAANAELAGQLAAQVEAARSGVSSFNARQEVAERLAAGAGPIASESWVAAEQALSLLVEQYGVTTRAAANIDELGSSRLQRERWISPADQRAIAAAAAEVAAISDSQAGAIDRLKNQLAR